MSSAGQALDSIDDEEEQPRSSTLAEEGQAGGRRAGRPVARPMGVEGLGVIALSGSGQLSAEELQVESDLRARLNELLVLTKEGTVDAVTGLGGLLTRDNDPGGGGGGGLQAGEQRVRAHRQSVYGLTREPPPWAVQPGAPTTSAKVRLHFVWGGCSKLLSATQTYGAACAMMSDRKVNDAGRSHSPGQQPDS